MPRKERDDIITPLRQCLTGQPRQRAIQPIKRFGGRRFRPGFVGRYRGLAGAPCEFSLCDAEPLPPFPQRFGRSHAGTISRI